jgi:hypothetical protein
MFPEGKGESFFGVTARTPAGLTEGCPYPACPEVYDKNCDGQIRLNRHMTTQPLVILIGTSEEEFRETR